MTCDGDTPFCNVDIMIPGVSPVGLTVNPVVVGEYALGKGVTISNEVGTYYLDGLKKEGEPPVVVLVEKKWGKEYLSGNVPKGMYRLHYKVKTGQCSVKDTVRTERDFEIFVNGISLGKLEFCERFVDKVYLPSGMNSIKVLNEMSEVVFERRYVAEN